MAKSKTNTAFRTIGEVAAELGLPQHVLRFWEGKFSYIKPHKRRGGHRYYRPADIDTLKEIKVLLYDKGYTIKGAQKHLDQVRKKKPAQEQTDQEQPNMFSAIEEEGKLPSNSSERIRKVLNELHEIRDLISQSM